ncbi:MAG: hypothetical protein Q9179_003736 [Wetmoreana sp. 5 TL-2023]
MGEPRNTARPRLSLNCFTCRRRKVRCTKERPACNSCLRTKDDCVYDENAWETARTQAKNKKNAWKPISKNRHDDREPTAHDEDWVDWTTKLSEFEPSRELVMSTMTEQEYSPESSLVNTGEPTPHPHRCLSEATQGSINTSDIPTSITNDMLFSNMNNIYDDLSTPTTWVNTHSVDLFETPDAFLPQTSMQIPGNTSSSDQRHLRALKRPHTPTEFPSQTVRSMDELPRANPERLVVPQRASPSLDDGQHASGTGIRDSPTAGYVSARHEARVRHANPAFWAYVKGYESTCEAFLDGAEDPVRTPTETHIDRPALAKLLSHLPSKQICNTLLYSFLISVHPLYPLIHVSTLRAGYNNFWQWYENPATPLSTVKLMDDPTFLCLLFSILYCGAVIAPYPFWGSGALDTVDKDVVTKNLRFILDASLKCVQYLQHPTINTLIASLLSHSFIMQGGKVDDLGNFSAVIRTAQRMGLHIEVSGPEFDVPTCEVRRRIWWHILWLDLQHSVMHGLPMLCFDNYAQRLAVREQRAEKRYNRAATGLVTPLGEECSASSIIAAGLFEAMRFERLLVQHCEDGAQARYVETISRTFANMQTTIDGLIATMPAQGIPEKGLIPSRLANASPLNKDLYGDHLHEPTVLTSLARVMLNMLKTEASILLQKTSLGSVTPNSRELQSRWDRFVTPLSYLFRTY